MKRAWDSTVHWSFKSPRLLLLEYSPARRALFVAMSLLPSFPTRIPGPPGSLCALLALLLLTPPRPLADAGPSSSLVRELRCQCLSITPKVHPKMISNLEMIVAGPQCPKVEVIATLKNGKEVCLDPEAPLVKKIIQKILSSRKQKN